MKVRYDFLKKVMIFGVLDTQNYRYRVKYVTESQYKYAIIERALLSDFGTSALSWQYVATTWDGKHFSHA